MFSQDTKIESFNAKEYDTLINDGTWELFFYLMDKKSYWMWMGISSEII